MEPPCTSASPWSLGQPQPPAQELAQAWEEADRQQRRADFLTDMLKAVLPDLASDAVHACVEAVIAQFRGEPARGFEDWGPTAWHEAAGILQADGHQLVEQIRDDLAAAALAAVAALSPTARLAAWLDTEPGVLSSYSDLWDRAELLAFDPLTGWPGCIDSVVERVARNAADQLRAADLAR